MKARELSESLAQHFLEELEQQDLQGEPNSPSLRVRNGEIFAKEMELHHGPGGKPSRRNPRGLDGWSKGHSREVKHIGRLPFMPDTFKSQRIDRASTPINRLAFWLPETTYLKTYRRLYNLAVGSKELAGSIIDGFDTTPAFADNDQTLTDYAVECLDNGVSFGITSGHLDRLSDIADFEAGLSLAVAARRGRKYLKNFKLLVNKNMTRESYKGIPLPLLMSTGLVSYWGLPPGESAETYEISDEIMAFVNALLVEQYRIDRGLGAVALGLVPAGSRPNKTYGPDGRLTGMKLKEAYAGSFMIRCAGGLIPANRFGSDIEMGQVIPVDVGGKKKTKNEVIEDANMIHATQGNNLAGVPVSFDSVLKPGHVITVSRN